MGELGKLVAVRSLDKVVIKGWTSDFRPNRDFFHVEEEGGSAPTRVPIENLKAIFFIKTLGRDPSCVDNRSFEKRVGPEKKVWIEFVDGEKMAGWSSSFGSPRKGFFVFPADPNSNTEMAYVFRSAIDQIMIIAGVLIIVTPIAILEPESWTPLLLVLGGIVAMGLGVYRVGHRMLPNRRVYVGLRSEIEFFINMARSSTRMHY